VDALLVETTMSGNVPTRYPCEGVVPFLMFAGKRIPLAYPNAPQPQQGYPRASEEKYKAMGVTPLKSGYSGNAEEIVRDLQEALEQFPDDPESVKERMAELLAFIERLYDEFEIRHIRTIPCTVYDERRQAEEELTNKELAFIFKILESLKWNLSDFIWQPYHDIIDMMLGYLDQTCVFQQCDPFHTVAEKGINHCGGITNCLRSGGAVEGLQVLSDDGCSRERYAILQQVPQELGGCKDCRFWHCCYGHCPGSGIDNDWRNRSRFCEGFKEFYGHIENRLKAMMPNLLLSPEFYPEKSRPEGVQKSLRTTGGSSFRQKVRFNIENVKKEFEQKKPISIHGGGHGDREHGDSDSPEWRKAHPGWDKK